MKKKAPVIPIALGAFALVVVIGLIIALTGGSDDDGDDIETGASSPAATAGSGSDTSNPSDTSVGGGEDPNEASFGELTISGDALPQFTQGDDAAVGLVAPELSGMGLDGSPSSVGGGPGEPTIVAFLAHWCPHCQRELPLLVEETDAGTFDGVRMVAVLTGTNPDAPNFPPGAWLQREGWTGDVVLDDDSYSAATSYGLTGYPYLVVLDADGKVVERASGEIPAEQLAELAAAAKG